MRAVYCDAPDLVMLPRISRQRFPVLVAITLVAVAAVLRSVGRCFPIPNVTLGVSARSIELTGKLIRIVMPILLFRGLETGFPGEYRDSIAPSRSIPERTLNPFFQLRLGFSAATSGPPTTSMTHFSFSSSATGASPMSAQPSTVDFHRGMLQ